MSRLHLTFSCGRHRLAGTLDTAPGSTGLLIVSGGNEIRSGAFSGMAHLASSIARAGFPVLRFDRRGVGDSEGENRGFRASAKDIASANHTLRALAPHIERVIAFGNCDAASALMISGAQDFDGIILSNPWTYDPDQADQAASPPPASIRQRYMQKLRNPREIGRLLSGGVDLRKLAQGLMKSVQSSPQSSGLLDEMRAGIEPFAGTVKLLLATGDRTAQSFEELWDAKDPRIVRCEGADHAFSQADHRIWLNEQILAALRG